MSTLIKVNKEKTDPKEYGKKVHVYTVLDEDGDEFTVDNRIFFDFRGRANHQETLIDFTECVLEVESLISFYETLETRLNRVISDIENEEYNTLKAESKQTAYGRNFHSVGEGDKEPSDRFIMTAVYMGKAHIDARGELHYVQDNLTRLKATYNMAKTAYDTARSLNSNERGLRGIGT